MSDSALAYAVRTATRQGVTRDLPHGPEDLQWVANSATLIYGDQDAVLVDTYTSIEQNAELVQWVRSFGKRLTYVYITHGHGDHFFGLPTILDAFPRARAVTAAAIVPEARGQLSPDVMQFWTAEMFLIFQPRRFRTPRPSPLMAASPLHTSRAGRGTVRSSGRSCSRDRSLKSHTPSLSAPSSSSWRDTGWRSSRLASPTPPTPPACGCPTSA